MNDQEWYADRNLRTARSQREAGIEAGPFQSGLLDDEPRVLAFLAGFSTGVLGTLFLILSRVLP
jgi:hypothetical protein